MLKEKKRKVYCCFKFFLKKDVFSLDFFGPRRLTTNVMKFYTTKNGHFNLLDIKCHELSTLHRLYMYQQHESVEKNINSILSFFRLLPKTIKIFSCCQQNPFFPGYHCQFFNNWSLLYIDATWHCLGSVLIHIPVKVSSEIIVLWPPGCCKRNHSRAINFKNQSS